MLINHGVDLDSIKLVRNVSAVDAINLFRKGEADYLHILHPYAQSLIDDGVGHMAASLGPELGYICYSSFAATPGFIYEHSDIVQAFVNGFQKALEWVDMNGESAIAERVSSFFPDNPQEVLARAIWQYKNQNTWPQDSLIGKDGYDAMRDILIEGGLVNCRHPYERLVRPEFALNAFAG